MNMRKVEKVTLVLLSAFLMATLSLTESVAKGEITSHMGKSQNSVEVLRTSRCCFNVTYLICLIKVAIQSGIFGLEILLKGPPYLLKEYRNGNITLPQFILKLALLPPWAILVTLWMFMLGAQIECSGGFGF